MTVFLNLTYFVEEEDVKMKKENDSGSDSAGKDVKPDPEAYDYSEWLQLIKQV